MILDTLFSRIRIFRFRLRYYYYKAKIKYPTMNFMWDNSKEYKYLLQKLKKSKYEKVVILGNAPNLISLNDELYKKYKNDDTVLMIGLNKSYIKYQTDILLWSDQIVMKELIEYNKIVPTTIFLFISQLLDKRLRSLKLWKEHRTFENYPYKTLFKARTILVSALHLAYILDIKDIHLFGISMDNGNYFYKNINARDSLEFLSDKRIKKQQHGYTMKKITQEILEFLIQRNFNIYYSGESDFLHSINGIKNVS